MSERTRRRCFRRRVIAVIALLALCVVAADAGGLVEPIVASTQLNTSPPLTATIDGVTLSAAHSRYLTIDAITLSLTNQSPAPVYLPIMSTDTFHEGAYELVEDGSAYGCSPIETEVDGQGWQSLGTGCYSKWQCSGGAAPSLPVPAVLVIKPGQTAVFPLYDGQSAYPLWSPGVYRFRVLFSHTPFQASQVSRHPLVIPQGVLLTSGPVTLMGAWWISPWYHQFQLHYCPVAA